MLKKASDMSVEELRAEVEKIEAQRAKRRAYAKAKRKPMTPEQKEKRKAYGLAYRTRQREVVARAAEVEATEEALRETPVEAVEPMPQTVAAAGAGKPKRKR